MPAPEAEEPPVPTPPLAAAPPRSEALEAELATLEALLPSETPPTPAAEPSPAPASEGGSA